MGVVEVDDPTCGHLTEHHPDQTAPARASTVGLKVGASSASTLHCERGMLITSLLVAACDLHALRSAGNRINIVMSVALSMHQAAKLDNNNKTGHTRLQLCIETIPATPVLPTV